MYTNSQEICLIILYLQTKIQFPEVKLLNTKTSFKNNNKIFQYNLFYIKYSNKSPALIIKRVFLFRFDKGMCATGS